MNKTLPEPKNKKKLYINIKSQTRKHKKYTKKRNNTKTPIITVNPVLSCSQLHITMLFLPHTQARFVHERIVTQYQCVEEISRFQ